MALVEAILGRQRKKDQITEFRGLQRENTKYEHKGKN